MEDDVLKQVRNELKDGLTKVVINQLLDDLSHVSVKVLNDDEAETIRDDISGRPDKARCLIDSVQKKGAKASAIFFDKLKIRDGQLYDKLELGQKLEGTPEGHAVKHERQPDVLDGANGAPSGPPVTDGDRDEEYTMNSVPRGYCVIINNVNFTKTWNLFGGASEDPTRYGSNKDVAALEKVFRLLGFTVEIYKDQTAKQIKELMLTYSKKQDHGDCFVCCVLSHGEKKGVCGTDWKLCPRSDFCSPFDGTNCPKLAGKPKVFFIQACRGGKRQAKVEITSDDAGGAADFSVSPDMPVESYSIPADSDFLISRSTVEDFVSYRNHKFGSWFIQSLCRHLEEGHDRRDDVLTILTKVNYEVSRMEAEVEIMGKKGIETVDAKATPEMCSTLTKKLIF